jgi:hypothetical protein
VQLATVYRAVLVPPPDKLGEIEATEVYRAMHDSPIFYRL